jgi:nitrogen regulatory protein PII
MPSSGRNLGEVRDRLINIGVEGLTVTEVVGYGRQRGHTEFYRGCEYKVDFHPKLMLTILASDDQVEEILNAIVEGARTGKIGDSKNMVTPVEEVFRIRSGRSARRLSNAPPPESFQGFNTRNTMACNGTLAELFAITFPCAFVSPNSAVGIGKWLREDWLLRLAGRGLSGTYGGGLERHRCLQLPGTGATLICSLGVHDRS